MAEFVTAKLLIASVAADVVGPAIPRGIGRYPSRAGCTVTSVQLHRDPAHVWRGETPHDFCGRSYLHFRQPFAVAASPCKSGLGASARQGALNRVASKHVDFVICSASDLSVLCAVELNDKSHGSKRAQARDEFVVGVCRAVGLPLLRVSAQRSYSVADIRTRLQSTIGVADAPVGSAVAAT